MKIVLFIVLISPALFASPNSLSQVFHCAQGSKQEIHLNYFQSTDTSLFQIQETDDAGTGTSEDGGQILIRQLGATTLMGHQYLLTIKLNSSAANPACKFPNANPFLFACNIDVVESNISSIELFDLTTKQSQTINDFSLFSIVSTVRSNISGQSGQVENSTRFQIRMFGSKTPWPNGVSETIVFTDASNVADTCQVH